MTFKPVARLFVTVIVFAAVLTPARAQYRGPDRAPVRFYADIGYVNLFAYPKWLTIGPEVELRLGPVFSLNPVAKLWVRESRGAHLSVIPGATLNIHIRRFVLGGGAVFKVPDWDEAAGGALVPQAQLGYEAGPTRLNLSFYYLSTTKEVVVAFSFGLRIGSGSRRGGDD
jgi:hypothetical protein